MPTIPTGDDFGARIAPVSNRSITTIQRPGFVSGIGSTLTQDYAIRSREEEQLLKEEQRRTNRLQVAKAKSAWLQEKVNTKKLFEQDQDYGTYEERYQERIAQTQPKVAELIEDPEVRALFEEEMEADGILGLQEIRGMALKRETDVEMAGLSESLAANKDAYLQADEITRVELVQSSTDYIDAAIDKGYITELKGSELKRATAQDYVVSKLEGMEHRDQLEFLRKDKMAKAIPVDVRNKIERNARDGMVLDDALMHVDSLFSQHGDDRASIMEGIAKIKNSKTRVQAQQHANARLAQISTAKTERSAKLYEGMLSELINGGDLQQIRKSDPGAWMELGGTKQAALIKASQGSTKDVDTDRAAYATFNRIAREDGQSAARQYLYENSEKFSLSDFKKLDDRANDEFQVDGYLTETQRLKQYVDAKNLNDEEAGKLFQAYDSSIQRYERANEKEPTMQERIQIMDSLMIEHDYPWYEFNKPDDGFAFELPQDVRDSRTFERAFKEREAIVGRPLSDLEKHQLFNFMQSKGYL